MFVKWGLVNQLREDYLWCASAAAAPGSRAEPSALVARQPGAIFCNAYSVFIVLDRFIVHRYFFL